MIYLILVLFLLLISILIDFKNLKVNRSAIWNFILVVLISLVGLRYKLGGDTFNYMRDFDEFPLFNDLDGDVLFGFKYAPLWSIFFSLCKTLVNDFVFFQIIHALFVNSVVFWFIQKYSKYRFTSVLFYFFYFYLYFNTEILRESVSICFFLLAVPSFLSSNWKKFYGFIILSILFHYSAVFLLVFPLMRKMKLSLFNLIVAGSLMYLIPSVIFDYAPPILKIYYDEYIVYAANFSGYVYTTVCFILFPLLIIYLQKKNDYTAQTFEMFIPIFFIIAVYSYISPSIALRFFNYLIPIAAVYFINVVGVLFDKKTISAAFLMVVLPSVFMYKSKEYFADTSGVLPNSRFYIIWHPYTNVFFKNDNVQRQIISRREQWVDSHFSLLVDDLKDLLK